MYQQPELPFGIARRGSDSEDRPRGGSAIDERFDDFHASNPWVLEALEELAIQWIGAGGGRIGVKALFEQLRWSSPEVADGEPFRLNNNFTSRYARLLCARHPEWVGVFQLRSLRTGDGERYSELDGRDQVK
ncbi:hypothetical protein ACFW2Y_14445 [Streptomyces sp. NPDC058877]|uniref:hypothetical protein n=1 Tax=Streptomyces sp. NPDC058877 TaxID=3346665 RepID=UPI0036A35A42